MEKFPVWKPTRPTEIKARSYNFRTRYAALRSSSASFIRRPDVKEIIYEKYEGKCYLCGSKECLQIDHIVSVYRYAKEEIRPIEGLNSLDNLALICRKCNAGKRV